MLKIIFLFTTLIIAISIDVSAQVVSTTEMGSTSFRRWRENTKIRYFGELLGSNLNKLDDNQYDHEGNKTNTPMNLYNQFNIQYRFLNRTSFLVGPRFYGQIGDRNELNENEDQKSIVIDDWQFGFVQELYQSKQIIFNGRLTHRQPFSRASQNNLIDSQIEYQNDLTWIVNSKVTALFWNTYRYYAYEAQKNEDRYRINFTTVLNYAFNDKWKVQLFHEWDLQHRAPKYGNRDVNKQDWNYFEKYKNQLAFGVGYSPTSKITFVPFIKALNDEDWSTKTTQMGLWLMAKVL